MTTDEAFVTFVASLVAMPEVVFDAVCDTIAPTDPELVEALKIIRADFREDKSS